MIVLHSKYTNALNVVYVVSAIIGARRTGRWSENEPVRMLEIHGELFFPPNKFMPPGRRPRGHVCKHINMLELRYPPYYFKSVRGAEFPNESRSVSKQFLIFGICIFNPHCAPMQIIFTYLVIILRIIWIASGFAHVGRIAYAHRAIQ